jgi:hypothetical protein
MSKEEKKEDPLPLSLDGSDEPQGDDTHAVTSTTVYITSDNQLVAIHISHCTCVEATDILTQYRNFSKRPEGGLLADLIYIGDPKVFKRNLFHALKQLCNQPRITKRKEISSESKSKEPSKKRQKKTGDIDVVLSKVKKAETAIENFMQGVQFVPDSAKEVAQKKEEKELEEKKEELGIAQSILGDLRFRLQTMANRNPEAMCGSSLFNYEKNQSIVVATLDREYKQLQEKKPKKLTIESLKLHGLLLALKELTIALEKNPSGTNTNSETKGAELVKSINSKLSGIDLDCGCEKESTLQFLVFLDQNVRLKLLQKVCFVSWLDSFCSSTPTHKNPKVHQRASSNVPVSKIPAMLVVNIACSKSPHPLDDSKGQGVPCTRDVFRLPSTAGPLFFCFDGVLTIRTSQPDVVKTVLEQTFFSLPQVFEDVNERRTGLLEALRCLKDLLLQSYLKPFAFSRLVERWLRTIDATDHASFLEDMIDFLTGLPSYVIPRELIQAMGRFCLPRGRVQHNDFLQLDSCLDAIGFYRKKWDKPADTKTPQACSSNDSKLLCACGKSLDVCRGQESRSTQCTQT